MFDKRKDNAEPQPQPAMNTGAMDKPSAPQTMASRNTAIIGETIKIKGDVTGDENLVIEGQVEGFVELKNHDLTVGQNGSVEADLKAKAVKVHGRVLGNIDGSDVVVVSKSGDVQGNITAPRVTLEDGAKFKGSIDMDPQSGSSKPEPAPKKEQDLQVVGGAESNAG